MAIGYMLGTFQYQSENNINQLDKLPEQLKMDHISSCGVLLELVMGKMQILDYQGERLYVQKTNYTKLPAIETENELYEQFNEVLNTDILDKTCKDICDRFLVYERKNNFVYEHILNELTQYFVINEVSPCEGFVHLYRSLEFMSYSFPLIYASKSRNYRGTYDSLKKFMSGDGGGELKFFEKFLSELFRGDMAYDFLFEIDIESNNIEELKKEFQEFFKVDVCTFEESVLLFKFKNIMEIFTEIRNRYFHMLLGKGKNNFFNIKYDKRDLFKSLNPVFINWLAVIFVKIIQHGLESFNS